MCLLFLVGQSRDQDQDRSPGADLSHQEDVEDQGMYLRSTKSISGGSFQIDFCPKPGKI